ncbi:hypothetical protein M3225_25605 [Priestia aryabhattai]|uniref:hypothetical protein n=1 Tax=Priestia aryabhattai TaxID=412384 RepID=UPI00203D85CF|nr:hypothetical protein [Priestia aryabhattai]MCM3773818.1 hypothetical protein [Priestia aryabhattai]
MSVLTFFVSNKILGLAIIHTKWFQTLATALVAAWFTQWLNNNLTRERERENKLKETFKEFYDKIVPEVYDYFSIETDFKKGHDLKASTNPREIKKSILETISENMIHINSEIHTAYRKIIRNKYFDDNSGFSADVDEITLLHIILEEYIKLAEKNEYAETAVAIRYACLLLIWKNVVINCQSYEMAYSAISRNFDFNTDKLDKEMLHRLKELEKIEMYSDERNILFRKLLTDLIKDDMSNAEKEELLKLFFENNEEMNDSRSISILENLDLDPGQLTIELRVMYRNQLLIELYNNKYCINEDSRYSFIYPSESLDSQSNELRNAINYWKEKKMVRFEPDSDHVKLVLTAAGEDQYEKEIYPDDEL